MKKTQNFYSVSINIVQYSVFIVYSDIGDTNNNLCFKNSLSVLLFIQRNSINNECLFNYERVLFFICN